MKYLILLFILIGCINNEGDITINQGGGRSSSNEDSNQDSPSPGDSAQETTEGSNDSGANSSLTSSDCPPNFLPVPGSTDLGTLDFCVMKYEARNDGSGNAILQDSNIASAPYGNLPGTSAFTKCEAYIENGFTGKFTLISNAEWMTIARNIEQIDSNWSSGTAGQGKLYVGHTDNNPAYAIASSLDDNQGYYLTGNSNLDAVGSGFEQKRTLELSNGAIIWDFAGNLAEWVDWDATNSQYDIGPNNTGNTFRDITVLAGSLTANDLQSAFGYGQGQYAGAWYGASSSQGSTYRGSSYNEGPANSGIFTLTSNLSANDYRSHMGFRCVYRP